MASTTDEPTEVENWNRERVLGSGGFGIVTLWRHKTKDEMIALKKCRWGMDNMMTRKHKERWEKEVEIMQRLAHRNVVKAVPVPKDLEILRSELPLLCMEYCSKGDLRQILNRPENCCGLRENEVRRLVNDVASAVEYLHTMKITHRDLKPENIVLQDVDGKIAHKLIDLGYAKELDQSSVCTSFVGTLQYLAPELFMSKKYSSSVDYWSLGLVTHECITGVRPFLPNMAPVAWMQQVQKKSSDDICAYQTIDGSIIFSKELFQQNHISTCLKYHLEHWLRYCLEWDAKKRGKVFSETGETKVAVFSLLNEIMEKKIVNIYSAETNQMLSYEIDNSTAMSTLQLWIERDTKLEVAEQEILLPRGNHADLQKEALQCWSSPDEEDWIVYVYRKGKFTIPQTQPKVPQLVIKMMDDPKAPFEYIHQKRSWAHAVFFLNQEALLYQRFLQAHRVKMMHILQRNSYLHKLTQRMMVELQQLLAQHHFFSESLRLDISSYEQQVNNKGIACNNIFEDWCRSQKVAQEKVKTIEKIVNQHETKANALNTKTLELQRSPFSKIRQHDALDTQLECGLKAYEALRRRPKEERYQKSDNVEMVKVVYNCLKQRDRLQRDDAFNKHLENLVRCQTEIEVLVNPVSLLLQQIAKTKTELQNAQLARQNSIWYLLSIAMRHQRKSQSPVDFQWNAPVVAYDPRNPVSMNSPVNYAYNVPAVPNHYASLPPMEMYDADFSTSSMIEKNKAIRIAIQESMLESYNQFKSIVTEDLDFSFLKISDKGEK